jgi:hypothetical protein
MCFGNPAKSLSIARSRMPAEQWAAFERQFKVFCDINGLPDRWAYWPTYDWAKWAYFCARSEKSAWQSDLAQWLRGEAGRHMASMRVAKGAPPSSHALQLKLWADQVEGVRPRSSIADPEQELWDLITDVKIAWEPVRDAHYERLAIAMMDDEQAVASLERWKKHTGEIK